jgi:hypothetical protein
MKKILSFAAVLLMLAGAFACGKESIQRKEELKMPQWSNATGYLSTLQDLECMDAQISISDDEWRSHSDITGTWMLLLDCSTEDIIDYSCESIIYTFDANGTVTIISSVNEIQSGQFEYDYYPDPYCPLCDLINPLPNLVIGANKSFCQVANNWLTTFSVDNIGVDGRNRGKMEKIFRKID